VSDERDVFEDSWQRGDGSTFSARDELTRTAACVRRARADEGARLSRRLHDQLGQTLIGLKMDLHWVGTRLPVGRGRVPAGVAERLVSMQERLDEAMGVIRRISRGVRADRHSRPCSRRLPRKRRRSNAGPPFGAGSSRPPNGWPSIPSGRLG
jgi:hypothetical protein